MVHPMEEPLPWLMSSSLSLSSTCHNVPHTPTRNILWKRKSLPKAQLTSPPHPKPSHELLPLPGIHMGRESMGIAESGSPSSTGFRLLFLKDRETNSQKEPTRRAVWQLCIRKGWSLQEDLVQFSPTQPLHWARLGSYFCMDPVVASTWLWLQGSSRLGEGKKTQNSFTGLLQRL